MNLMLLNQEVYTLSISTSNWETRIIGKSTNAELKVSVNLNYMNQYWNLRFELMTIKFFGVIETETEEVQLTILEITWFIALYQFLHVKTKASFLKSCYLIPS